MGAMGTLLLCAILVSHDRVADVPTDRVDLIEVNHCYDQRGRLVFDQVLFYHWSSTDRRFHVRDWRLLKHPGQLPHKMLGGTDYVAIWLDGDVVRRVVAPSVRETWTQYDPEVVERDRLPKEARRKLQAYFPRVPGD